MFRLLLHWNLHMWKRNAKPGARVAHFCVRCAPLESLESSPPGLQHCKVQRRLPGEAARGQHRQLRDPAAQGRCEVFGEPL
eukprot:6060449-Alexandrium_andersonii.AAC.1